jgi:predicted PurR-regulated permease PerM
VNAEHITVWTSTLGRRAAASAVSFVATLIALFLVLRDGAWLADHALTVAGRMLGSPGERLARKIADAIRATVNGTVAAGGAWLMAAGLAGFGTAVLLEMSFCRP